MNTYSDRIDKQNAAQDIVPVVLIRHAESLWNRENRFTGWADPALTENGVVEAKQAAACLRAHGYRFDVAYSSRLQRAVATRDLLLEGIGQTEVPVFEDWRLNERHYGTLQGVDKSQAVAQVGEHQVWRWRRSYTDRAEPLPLTHPDHPRNDPLYADINPASLPSVENLAETRARVVEFWNHRIVPQAKQGRRVLISAHGNTLRALLMKLSGMTIAEVEGFEIPTATPIIYTFSTEGKPLHWRYLDPSCGDLLSA